MPLTECNDVRSVSDNPFGELVVECRLPLGRMKAHERQVFTLLGRFGALVTVSHM